MEYITITSDSYESCVSEAKAKYGERVRIHSRRDYTVGGGLFAKKRNKCEIVCYLAPEKAVANSQNVTKEDLKELIDNEKTKHQAQESISTTLGALGIFRSFGEKQII